MSEDPYVFRAGATSVIKHQPVSWPREAITITARGDSVSFHTETGSGKTGMRISRKALLLLMAEMAFQINNPEPENE